MQQASIQVIQPFFNFCTIFFCHLNTSTTPNVNLKIKINLPSKEQICLASCRASTTVCRVRCRVAPSSHTWACFIHWSWSEEAPALSPCVRCCVVFVLLRCVLCLQSSFGSSFSWLFLGILWLDDINYFFNGFWSSHKYSDVVIQNYLWS